MVEDVKGMAEHIGWWPAVLVFVLVMAHKVGIVNVKVGGKDDVSELRKEVQALMIQVARIEAILKERERV